MAIYQSGIAELLRSDAVTDAVAYHGERISATAKGIAPVDSGDYRDSIHVERDGDEVRVVADVDYSVYVEADSGTLARAVNLTPYEEV